MRIPKKYGSYQTSRCPFCDRTATQKNGQGLNVCHRHTKDELNDARCLCGALLEVRQGKFGPYFNCIDCGNINFNKAMKIRELTETKRPLTLALKERGDRGEKEGEKEGEKGRKETASEETTPAEITRKEITRNDATRKEITSKEINKTKTVQKEITISSDDVEYFD